MESPGFLLKKGVRTAGALTRVGRTQRLGRRSPPRSPRSVEQRREVVAALRAEGDSLCALDVMSSSNQAEGGGSGGGFSVVRLCSSVRPVAFVPSRRVIDNAGIILRDWWLTAEIDLADEAAEAAVLVWEYRRTFRTPLQKVTVGVRQFVERESSTVIVGQRLKRVPTILDKLSRLPTMKVTRMEDIGGCRAILPGGRTEIEGVLRRMEKNRWTIRRFRDYISKPKETGYRAIHVVVERDERPIEIQLRTTRQHAWAASVERVGAMLGDALKDGVGPDDLVELFRLLAYSLALQDEGIDADEEHKTRLVDLFLQVQARYPDLFGVR